MSSSPSEGEILVSLRFLSTALVTGNTKMEETMLSMSDDKLHDETVEPAGSTDLRLRLLRRRRLRQGGGGGKFKGHTCAGIEGAGLDGGLGKAAKAR